MIKSFRSCGSALKIAATLLWLFLGFVQTGSASGTADGVSADSVSKMTVSVLTCSPGPEVYELCGHSALRIRQGGRDVVWNYGVFDFNAPNFIYRFVKGESDYMLAGAWFEDFMYQYRRRGSRVVEQELNLNDAEKEKLKALIENEALPENRTYRYNYVLDNCATRILDRIEQSADARVVYPDTLYYPTYRREMMNYHVNYPWYQFGIDLALGEGLDRPLTGREDMFAPLVMHDKLENTFLSDGRKLVKAENVIFEGSNASVLPPTPWWKSPRFVFWMLFGVAMVMSAWQISRRRLCKWVYLTWFVPLALSGSVITFLVICSEHEATSPNLLIFWMNPLQIIPAIAILLPRLRKIGIAIAVYNIIILVWQSIALPLSERGAQGSILPIMLTTLLLSLLYLYMEVSASRRKIARTVSDNAAETKK